MNKRFYPEIEALEDRTAPAVIGIETIDPDITITHEGEVQPGDQGIEIDQESANMETSEEVASQIEREAAALAFALVSQEEDMVTPEMPLVFPQDDIILHDQPASTAEEIDVVFADQKLGITGYEILEEQVTQEEIEVSSDIERTPSAEEVPDTVPAPSPNATTQQMHSHPPMHQSEQLMEEVENSTNEIQELPYEDTASNNVEGLDSPAATEGLQAHKNTPWIFAGVSAITAAIGTARAWFMRKKKKI